MYCSAIAYLTVKSQKGSFSSSLAVFLFNELY